MAQLTVSYDRAGDKQVIDTNSKVLGEIAIDYSEIPADQRGGTAKQLLAASTLHCFCGSLAKALETRGAEYERITGTATLETGVDDKKRARVTGITLDVTVHMDEDYGFIFDRVEKIMRKGCLITASLHEAFPMTYNLHLEEL
ncbi:OsmC family protein [Maridesulfovibrio sp.]|uniref:OsmC family protein n=1 Tax=Maridesulfovibrio sp. TaxID=2795000 RepID=UPI002A18D6E6|nr:OsmC family protein [Maridesulfovibrio sp.]